MPGLFTKVVHRLNDALEYHAEFMEDGRAGRRTGFGKKTEAWYEEEERRRRNRHRRRRHHREGVSREGESVDNGGADAADGGERGVPGEEGSAEGERGLAAEEGDAGAPAGQNHSPAPGERDDHRRRRHHSGNDDYHGHRRHRSRDRDGDHHRSRGHRRRHNDDDAGIEILQPQDAPLGRELPPQAPDEGPRRQNLRNRGGWVDRQGRSVSPPRVELRGWVKKLFGKQPPQQNPKGNLRTLKDPRYRDNGRQQPYQPRAPGHPYIDDEESMPGHPYIGSEHSIAHVSSHAIPVSDQIVLMPEEPPASEIPGAMTEEREMAQAEEDARATEHAHMTEQRIRVEDVEELPPDHAETHGEPLSMPEAKDFLPEPSSHSTATPAHHEHLNLDTDSESEVSDDVSAESDTSTKATTATAKGTPRRKTEGSDDVSVESDTSTKATTARPKEIRKRKKPSMRGGAGGWSDADEYDVREEYDDNYENQRWNPRRDRHPTINHSGPSYSHFSQGFAPGPARPQPVDHSDSPFYRYGAAYVPPPRPGHRFQPGGYAFTHGFGSKSGWERHVEAMDEAEYAYGEPDPRAYGPDPRAYGPNSRAYQSNDRGDRGGRRDYERSRSLPRNKPHGRPQGEGARPPPRGSRYEKYTEESYYGSESGSQSSYYSSEWNESHQTRGRSGGRSSQPRPIPPKPEDYYAILGVSPDSTEEE